MTASKFLDIRPSRRKSKIITTLGPASFAPETIRSLVQAGTNVFRLNFSHGDYAQHLNTLNNIRAVAAESDAPVAVMQDLCGPKIRISKIEGDTAVLEDHSRVELCQGENALSSASRIYTEAIDPARYLKAGERVLLADGLIELRVLEINHGIVTCEVVKGGKVLSRQGIAFPESDIDLPAATGKDMQDLAWGISHGVDYVALSFVGCAQDIIRVREAIEHAGSGAQIIAKIERPQALDHIEEILAASDAIMVARGDLGINVPLEHVPLIQRKLIRLANLSGKPVIVATQMLRSMINSTRPTRAEVTDVTVAVLMGADALMLSEETAMGEHPVACVKYLDSIAAAADAEFDYERYRLSMHKAESETVPDAVAYAACAAAHKLEAAALIAGTETGTSARLVAKYRPERPLYGATSCAATLRRMALYWGVMPVLTKEFSSRYEQIDLSLAAVATKAGLPKGARIVITSGLAHGAGGTNAMQVREW